MAAIAVTMSLVAPCRPARSLFASWASARWERPQRDRLSVEPTPFGRAVFGIWRECLQSQRDEGFSQPRENDVPLVIYRPWKM